MQLKSRGVLLALVAVFAMSAVTAAAASATTPEFKPVPTKKKFKMTTGIALSTYEGGEDLACASSTATGEITSATTVGDVVEKFIGCKVKTVTGGTCPVRSRTGQAEEVITNNLKGELGTTSFGVGLLLEPTTGKNYIQFEQNGKCMEGGDLIGSLAGVLEPVGSKRTGYKLVYLATGNHEDIEEMTLDSGTLSRPELTFGASTFSTTMTDELKFEEAVEIT